MTEAVRDADVLESEELAKEVKELLASVLKVLLWKKLELAYWTKLSYALRIFSIPRATAPQLGRLDESEGVLSP